ncbi:hypothetical protein RHMOL_Rhmol07G0176100 [Rhododendron molle]|uniref:Uncharacterized protein n=1 Tax=Rhododendron molle TaxID=49168 RepID=A0ACC0N1J6_RHOML|nr:hypothetical protein RHMOL_Rhmol07G0176100 [Rhododendron molle]
MFSDSSSKNLKQGRPSVMEIGETKLFVVQCDDLKADGFGKILELFIPNKTRKEAYQDIEGVNGSWVWNYKINIARYLKVTQKQLLESTKGEEKSSTFKSQKKVWRRKKVNPDTGIKEEPNLSQPIKLKKIGNEWLSRSIIAKLSVTSSIHGIRTFKI